jgi:hypothetical protein
MTLCYLPVVSARRINSCVLERLEDRLTGHQEVSLLLRIQLKRGQFNRISFAASLVEPSREERAGMDVINDGELRRVFGKDTSYRAK